MFVALELKMHIPSPKKVLRDRFKRFAHALFDEGVYMSPSAALHSVLATVHTEEDVTHVVAAASAALDACA